MICNPVIVSANRHQQRCPARPVAVNYHGCRGRLQCLETKNQKFIRLFPAGSAKRVDFAGKRV